ncbi:MAG TPA: hypothetical protein VF528_15830 [Pyrinomonadaceae bacterium]|jgi:hypothetical protein
MNFIRKGAASLMLALLICIAQPCLAQTEKAVNPTPPAAAWKGFTIVQYNLRQKDKHFPVEVTYTTMGGLPIEVLLKQVGLRSYSPKVVTAVRLGWHAVVWTNNTDLRDPELEIVISGQTPVINLIALAQNESCDVSMNAMPRGFSRAEKKIETGFPLLSLNDIRPLTADGTLRTMKERYAFIVYVNEVLFADGTMWQAKGKPPTLDDATAGK